MTSFIIPENTDGFLYVVSDSHLDETTAPYDDFIQQLHSLKDPSVLVILGDLFKIWIAVPSFWSAGQRRVLEALHALKEQGVCVIFVVGNRELALPKKWDPARQTCDPFSFIVWDDGILEWNDRRYGFFHGDTINPQDKAYLRWRRIVRSRPFTAFLHHLPAWIGRPLAAHGEQALQKTNGAFRIYFPEDAVFQFTKMALPQVDQYFIGHFHQDRTFQIPAHPGSLRVVPDWLAHRIFLRIDPEGTTVFWPTGS